MKRQVWIAIGLGALILTGVLGRRLAPSDEARGEDPGAAAERGEPRGEPAPTIYFETLEGSTASLLDYTGRVVVLNLWGTWCAPCRYEIPELAELHAAYEDRGAIVIGLAIDSGDAAQIGAFAERYGVNYPIWTSTGAIAVSEFEAVGYPFTLVVDQAGRIRERYLGPQTFATLAADLDALLTAPGGAPGTSDSGG